MRVTRPLLLAAAAVLALPAPGCVPPSPAERSIEAANRRLVEAVRHADAAAFAAEYLDEARMLPPDAPEVVGRDALRASIEAWLRQGLRDLALETHDVVSRGELAYERGSFRMTLAPADAPSAVRTGKYVTIWRRGRDLAWKISIDIFNYDAPPAAAASTRTASPPVPAGPSSATAMEASPRPPDTETPPGPPKAETAPSPAAGAASTPAAVETKTPRPTPSPAGTKRRRPKPGAP